MASSAVRSKYTFHYPYRLLTLPTTVKTGTGTENGTGRMGNNILVPLPVSDQCEHLCTIILGPIISIPCTSPRPVTMQCELSWLVTRQILVRFLLSKRSLYNRASWYKSVLWGHLLENVCNIHVSETLFFWTVTLLYDQQKIDSQKIGLIALGMYTRL